MIQSGRFLTILALLFLGETMHAYTPAPYEPLIDALFKTFETQMQEELHLEPTGSGGSMPHDVEGIEVTFTALRRISQDEAREILIKGSQVLLHLINSNEELRPYLREFPFRMNRISLHLFTRNNVGSHYADGTIAYAALTRNTLSYDTFDPITEKFIALSGESFDTATQIATLQPLQRDLCYHANTPHEADMDRLFDSFCEHIFRKKNCYTLSFGGKIGDNVEELSIKLLCKRRASLEEARILEVNVTEKFLSMINNDLALRPYLKEYPFPASRVRTCIVFTDKDNCHYTNGGIATVLQEKGKVVYTIERPPIGNRYLDPSALAQESYEEAQRVVHQPKESFSLFRFLGLKG